MSGLKDTNVIDVVAQAPDGHYMLVMVEDRPWGTEAEQPAQLRAKINAYAGSILDGSLAHRYPEIAGQPVHIQLDCHDLPTNEIAAVVQHGILKLKQLGIGFRVNVRG